MRKTRKYMNNNDVINTLLEMGIPAHMLKDFPVLPTEVEGILIYGSQARGDAGPDSDLDILALVPRPRPSTHSGDVNISYYTLDQLSTGAGTLFGSHLKRDAKIIQDDTGYLTQAIINMGEVNTNRLFNRARNMSQIFTNLDRDIPKHLSGLLRQARYLLRSCLYAQAIAEDRPCFSVRELSARHSDEDLPRLLTSRPEGENSVKDLEECLSRLREIVGDFPHNKHGSLEATVINEWGNSSDVLSMAFLALEPKEMGGDYTEMEMILL